MTFVERSVFIVSFLVLINAQDLSGSGAVASYNESASGDLCCTNYTSPDNGSDNGSGTQPPTIVYPPLPVPEGCPCGSPYFNVILLMLAVPCHQRPVGFGANVLTTYRKCDAFIFMGALEAANVVVLQDHLPLFNCYFLLTDVPSFTNGQENLPQIVKDLYDDYARGYNTEGVIGPDDPYLYDLIKYSVERDLKSISISYTSDALRGYIYNQSDVQVRYRFTTAASSSFLNKVRLKLLNDFNWRRIAVFSTDDAHNAQMAVDFVKLCKQNDSLDVFFPGTIHDDPSAIYRLLLSDDRRIIVAFFPMEYFRYFICKAIKFGLMTDKHVWILPGIYDYQWWYNCTCDDITTTICSCNECDETEILDAIQGTIFVDSAKHNSNHTANNQTSANNNNYSINEVFEQLIEVYFGEEVANTFSDSDCQYFLHSNRFNAYDAAFLWGLAWHEAVYQILNSSTNATETCGTLRRPTNSYTGISRVTDLMAGVLTESIYCGYSGCYHFNYDNDYDLSQAMITQFYGESECVIGHYRNYNITAFDDYFDFKLHPFNVSYLLNSTVPILFDNTSTSSCLSIDNTSNVTCPYRWKGINDTLSWIAPVDGSCWDEDCRCYNKLEEWEAILSLVVMVTGITVSLILLVINWILKKNKHIKASSPIFNTIIIIGCIMTYSAIAFIPISFSDSFFSKSRDVLEILLPVSCELAKWLLYFGLVIILATVLIRNWRIYKIFYNPRIEEKKYLSNKIMCLSIISLVLPVFILLAVWTGVDHYKFHEEVDSGPNKCPDLQELSENINTSHITYSCRTTSVGWDGSLIIYFIILSIGLIFLSLQNAKIETHFAQEGDFAAKAVFVIFLFLVPFFITKLVLVVIVNEQGSRLLFWLELITTTAFPTVIIGGLFIPKFIIMAKDDKQRRMSMATTKLASEYQRKLEEIEHFKKILETRDNNSQVYKLRLSSVSSTISTVSSSAQLLSYNKTTVI